MGAHLESAVLEQTQAAVAGMTAASTMKLVDNNMNSLLSWRSAGDILADGTTCTGRSNNFAAIIRANHPISKLLSN